MSTEITQPDPFRCVWAPPEAAAIVAFLKVSKREKKRGRKREADKKREREKVN